MSAPVVTVLGLGEAGGRLAADLVSAGVEVHGYDPLITSRSRGRRPVRTIPSAAVSRSDGRARADHRVDGALARPSRHYPASARVRSTPT